VTWQLDGALDSNPDIYVPEIEEIVADASQFVLPEPSFKVSKMDVSDTDEDFEMFTDSLTPKELKVSVKPVTMTFEEFYCGFTKDSHPAFSCKPDAGRTERRNGPPTEITVTCNPKGASGEVRAQSAASRTPSRCSLCPTLRSLTRVRLAARVCSSSATSASSFPRRRTFRSFSRSRARQAERHAALWLCSRRQRTLNRTPRVSLWRCGVCCMVV
jgi:hypothetical protein